MSKVIDFRIHAHQEENLLRAATTAVFSRPQEMFINSTELRLFCQPSFIGLPFVAQACRNVENVIKRRK